MQTYDVLDQHAKKLDRYLSNFGNNAACELRDSKNEVVSPRALNMEVDPNEPTYCICGQVAFGEMISCDDPKCDKEWFHVQCVGGAAGRVGETWICPICTEKRKKSSS